ncbi:MAG: UDP-N-acetylmuramoyl-L-alanyl-D-glutamate--2,6-diaminopimelate ligase [bacterium]|nr:UDP-N-acetylmuramoyl-L-alanyl-D-glutamate--2,6-diaminopimelate ligase [bacterium]MCP5070441.1 UDP-N-acetylmuramoyl-L-alanyl-D-glutamate--2,6-diaminopimelate ligase [bacterium]
MHLSELLAALPPSLAPTRIEGDDPVVRGITYDSRSIAAGDLFVALKGGRADGHRFLAQARTLGAVALLIEEPSEGTEDIAYAVVPDSRRALASIAARFFGQPAEELALLGVTGTNGKTSTTYLIESILAAAGISAGLIGTIEVRYAGEHERAVNTTPESLDLQRVLRAMVTRGVRAVAIEVSSHGLALGRVTGCSFKVCAVTNVTQDHLDFHENMQAYTDAKLALFRDHLAPGGWAVVNIDDPSADQFLRAGELTGARLLRVTRNPDNDAELRVLEADVGVGGTRALLALPSGELEVELPLVGDFNVENLAIAVGVAFAHGVALEAIARGVEACPQVPGRVERVAGERRDEPTVIVDYAHTPDAVDKLLRTLRPLTPGRLITVFGCGGDRDQAKRPLMAEAVARWTDRAVATSDNPRTEDPRAILRDVEAGLGGLERCEARELDTTEKGYASLVDRRAAIECAIALARPDDTVVLAGKGHEDYQIIGDEKLPFDDREQAARALAGRAR